MNVGRLKELLEEMDDERDVRLVFQQSWPLQFDLLGIVDDIEDLTRDDEGNPILCQKVDQIDGEVVCERAIYQQDEKLFCPIHGDVTKDSLGVQEVSNRVYLIAYEGSPYTDPYGKKQWWDTCQR